ncbi:MAG TPA: hypothetical protein VJ937_04085 [Salinivirga sp.]|uniref:hypothetical protein n=1 Tax=Salinivirga sp. TaxID=1970192 RepID=UPI002B47618B|nr:hypothetical protein [Salinivirga sp.]HKK58631.1 hypothetical protein [Salinivirga sp.]
MKNTLLITLLTAFFIAFTSCGHQTDAVDSGTYDGTVKEVEAEKSEIYVETKDGKTLELYFIEETRLTKNGQVVEFSALKEGQKVTVKVEKVGKRLDPLKVQIKE